MRVDAKSHGRSQMQWVWSFEGTWWKHANVGRKDWGEKIGALRPEHDGKIRHQVPSTTSYEPSQQGERQTGAGYRYVFHAWRGMLGCMG